MKMHAKLESGRITSVVHEGSKARILTDAPADVGGDGSQFSPTDLVAAALASCAIITMAGEAAKHGIRIDGTRAEINKEMVNGPRRIGHLDLVIYLPKLDPRERELMVAAAHGCPVHRSLNQTMKIDMRFEDIDG